jgi:hypothetical protein
LYTAVAAVLKFKILFMVYESRKMNEVFCPASGVGEGIDRWTEHTRIRR